MPADTVKYQVLDVGQGSANFIEMYEGGVLTATVLIDLGSERASDVGGGLSVEYIVSQLNTMTTPRIGCIFLSHSDTDHISLLDQLLDSFTPPGDPPDPPKKELRIDKVSYGGDPANYAKGRAKYNVLNRLKKYMVPFGRPWPLSPNYGGYREVFPGLPPFPEVSVEGVDFYVLIANAPAVAPVKRSRASSGSRPTGYAKNTVSQVVVMSYGGGQYIATGDATGATLVAANAELTPHVLTTFFRLVVMVTAPHHGSESTTFSFRASDGTRDKAEPVANFKLFVDSLKSKTISASAGKVDRFKHPSAFLLSFFWPYLHDTSLYTDPTLTASDGHYYTAFFRPIDGYMVNDGTTTAAWPAASKWYTVQTASNIYTNTYYDLVELPASATQTQVIPPNPGSVNAVPTMAPYPPAGVAWTYDVVKTATGSEVSVERLDTHPNLLALRREIIARSERMAAARDALERAAATRTPAPRVSPRALLDAAPPRAVAEPPQPAPASGAPRRVKVLT